MPAASSLLIATALVATGTSAYFQNESLGAGKDARRSQQALEEQRRKELADQAAAREAAKARAASTGQRVGRSPGMSSSFSSALGFGSGNTQQGLSIGGLFGN